MIHLVLATAAADPASTPGCATPRLLATAPPDGATVPVDAVFTALLDRSVVPLCWQPTLELVDDGERPVPAELAIDEETGLYRLIPLAPLALGATYTFRATEGYPPEWSTEATVTVGEPPPPPDEPPTFAFTAEPSCDAHTTTTTATLVSAEPVTGLLRVETILDGGSAWSLLSARADTLLSQSATRDLAVEACASAALEDLAGEVLWTFPEVCAPEFHCPSYGPPRSVESSAEARCGSGATATRLEIDVDLPDATPDAEGTLLVEVTTDLGSQGVVWSDRLRGVDGDRHLEQQVLGGHDVCFEVVLLGAAGEELWRDGPHCTDEPVICPEAAPAPGCGCGASWPAGLGSLPPWGALAAVCAAARRRRRSARW